MLGLDRGVEVLVLDLQPSHGCGGAVVQDRFRDRLHEALAGLCPTLRLRACQALSAPEGSTRTAIRRALASQSLQLWKPDYDTVATWYVPLAWEPLSDGLSCKAVFVAQAVVVDQSLRGRRVGDLVGIYGVGIHGREGVGLPHIGEIFGP